MTNLLTSNTIAPVSQLWKPETYTEKVHNEISAHGTGSLCRHCAARTWSLFPCAELRVLITLLLTELIYLKIYMVQFIYMFVFCFLGFVFFLDLGLL